MPKIAPKILGTVFEFKHGFSVMIDMVYGALHWLRS